MIGDNVLLRQCVLATSALGLAGSEVELAPHRDGFELVGDVRELVTWADLHDALAGADPQSETARIRMARWLRLRQLVSARGRFALPLLARHTRLMALPADHTLHPGGAWVVETLSGGSLTLGVGLQGIESHPDDTQPLPPGIVRALGADVSQWWGDLRDHATRMGSLAATRLQRDGDSGGVLRPIGGCDVLSLLTSMPLREYLTSGDSVGMRAVAVPSRQRGWYDLRHADPAFILAAWNATDAADRGLSRGALVTTDSVAMTGSDASVRRWNGRS